MVIGCGSLSQVNDDHDHDDYDDRDDDDYYGRDNLVRTNRRSGGVRSSNKKTRRSRTIKDRFRNAFSRSERRRREHDDNDDDDDDHRERANRRHDRRRNDDPDPLSLVGCEFSVREYPLAALEPYRNGNHNGRYGGNNNNGHRRRRNHSPPPPPPPMIHHHHHHHDEEEPLLHLQNVVYENITRSLSEGDHHRSTSSRGGGGSSDDNASASAKSANHLSAVIQRSIHNTYSHHAQHVRRRVLTKIHGKNHRPSCPQCRGNLRYRYVSNTTARIGCGAGGAQQQSSVRDVLAGNDPTNEKLRNLLPPLCERCETHFLFESSECKEMLMDNFDAWLDQGGLDDNDNDDDNGNSAGGGALENVKIVVVDDNVNGNDDEVREGAVVAAGGPLVGNPSATPRWGNGSSVRARSSSRFEFDAVREHDDSLYSEEMVLDNPVFSGISDLSDGAGRHNRGHDNGGGGGGGTPRYEQPMVTPRKNKKRGSDVIPGKSEALSATDVSSRGSSEVSGAVSVTSDADPFSELQTEDELTIVGTGTADNNDGDYGTTDRSGEFIDTDTDQRTDDGDIPVPRVGSIKVIHTESEERAILECYSIKREVATKQIAKDLIRGHELTTLECDRCQMPLMMQKDGTALPCVACPAILRNAKRVAKLKRKAELLKLDELLHDLPAGEEAQERKAEVEEERNDVDAPHPAGEEGSGTDESAGHSTTFDLIYASLEKKEHNGTGTTQSYMDNTLNKDSISLAILDAPYPAGEEGSGTDESAGHSTTYDLIYASLEKKEYNDTGTTQSYTDKTLNKDSMSLAILDETLYMNALEEGRLGYTHSSDDNGIPFECIIGDCAEAFRYGPCDGPGAVPFDADFHRGQSSSSSNFLNAYNRRADTREDSVTCSRSENSISHVDAPSYYSYGSRSTQPPQYPAVEHSLSSYQDKTVHRGNCQRQQPVSATREEAGGEQQQPLFFPNLSNQYLGSISEVSEQHGQRLDDRHEGSLSEVSGHRVTPSRYPSSETMYCNNYQSNTATEGGNQMQHGPSNPLHGSSSEVSEHSQGLGDRYEGSQSEVSGHRVATSHCPSSETMFRDNYQSNTATEGENQINHGLSNPSHGLASEVSACQELSAQPSHDISSGETIRRRQDESPSVSKTRSDESETICPRDLPSSPLYHALSGQKHAGSVPEAPAARQGSAEESIPCPSSEIPTHGHQCQENATADSIEHLSRGHRNRQPEGSSSNVSDTRCPRDLPPDEMLHTENAGDEMKTCQSDRFEDHGDCDQQPEGSTSSVSDTRCPRDLPPGEMIHAEAAGEVKTCRSGHSKSSISEMTISRGCSDVSSTQCPRNLASISEMIYPQFQPNAGPAVKEHSHPSRVGQHQSSSVSRGGLREDSPTRCSRDVTSDEMIWNRESDASAKNLEPTRGALEVKEGEMEEMDNAKCCNPRNASSVNPSGGIKERSEALCDDTTIFPNRQVHEIQNHSPHVVARESCKNQYESERTETGRPMSYTHVFDQHEAGVHVEGKHEVQDDCSEMLFDVDNRHDGQHLAETARDVPHSSASSPNMQGLSGTLPVQIAEQEKTPDHRKSNTTKDGDDESLSDRIARLAGSLRDVADRLPAQDNGQHAETGTVDQHHNTISPKNSQSLSEGNQQRPPPVDLRNLISPVTEAKYQTKQNNEGQNNTLYPCHQTEKLPVEDNGKLKELYEDINYDRPHFTEKLDCSAIGTSGRTLAESHLNISCRDPLFEEKTETIPLFGRAYPSPRPDHDDQIKEKNEKVRDLEKYALRLSGTPLQGGDLPPLFSPVANEGGSPYKHNRSSAVREFNRPESLPAVATTDEDRNHDRPHFTEKIDCSVKGTIGQTIAESHLDTTCRDPIFEEKTETIPLSGRTHASSRPDHGDRIKEKNEKIRDSQKYNLRLSSTPLQGGDLPPLFSPVANEGGSPYEHNRSPAVGDFNCPESLPAVAATDSIARPVNFWQHKNYTPSPIHSLRSRGSFGTVPRDEKQRDLFNEHGGSQLPLRRREKNRSRSSRRKRTPRHSHSSLHEHRSDPPGHRMAIPRGENRDPPGTPGDSHFANVTPRSKSQPKSQHMRIPHDDKVATSRDVERRDPSPDRSRLESSDGESRDPPGTPSGSHFTHTNATPKSKRRLPISNAKAPKEDEVATPSDGLKTSDEELHPELSAHKGIASKSKEQNLRVNSNSSSCGNSNEDNLQALREEMEKEQQRIIVLREERRQQKEQLCLQEEQRLQEERDYEQQQHPQALRKERERQQCIAQEETHRMHAEQTRLQEQRQEEEKRLLQEDGEREQHRLQALSEEGGQQHCTAQEEARIVREEQRRLQEEREEEERFLKETEREQQHLKDLREERERQQRIVQEETHRIKEEQRRTQERREEEKRLLREEGKREQERLRALRKEQKRQQRIVEEETRRLQEEQRFQREERSKKKRLLQKEEESEQQRLRVLCIEQERQQRIVEEETCRVQEEQRHLREQRQKQKRLLQKEGKRQHRPGVLRGEQERKEQGQRQHSIPSEDRHCREEQQCMQEEWEPKQPRLACEPLVVESTAKITRGQVKQYGATLHTNCLHAEANEPTNVEKQLVHKAESESRDHSQSNHLQGETVQSNSPSWVTTDRDHPQLQMAKSWGESSLNELFKQIDEIEDDFHTIVASLPSSDGTIASSLKDFTRGEKESPKSLGDEKHSVFEITLNNAGSFESNASGDSTVADVVQRMRRIKDYIEHMDSVDESSDGSVSSYDSQGEMSQLIMRLTNAAAELRTFHEWDD